ncbi:unnamed protein product [Microthlaspi erraticum]|uniref:SKP1 component POZ domain-containing protein n=1 Tax=Microthlaspi erraticum TaxID=1685480 RepID=A0A6D2HQ05_9BRAS|nr:unnamed protein product [Microthlaspi erraticum]
MSRKKKKKKMIVLKSSDNKSFKVEEAVALQSQTIAHMVGDDCGCPKIRLENVTGKTLSKVIEYCNKHAYGDSFSKEDLKQWDAQFMNNIMDHSTIFELLVAANYLNIKGLLHLTCQTIAQEKKNLEKVIWNYKWILLRPDSTEFMALRRDE